MPIKPENVSRYPPNWRELRRQILARANGMCERCGVPNHVWRIRGTDTWSRNEMQVETWATCDELQVSYIVLTVAHLNHQPEDNRLENLQTLCQRCHLRLDQQHHAETAYASRRQGRVVADLFAAPKPDPRLSRAKLAGAKLCAFVVLRLRRVVVYITFP